MDRELVKRLAQSCGITLGKESVLTTEELCCFVSLIAEECANVCSTLGPHQMTLPQDWGYLSGVEACEMGIRSKFGI